jgi:hypothetical protein
MTGWVQVPVPNLGLEAFERTMLMGQIDPTTPGPQVQLVAQDVGTVFGPHFHDVDQFQVVLAGGGTIGRTRVEPGQVIFVDRHKVYGPVCPDQSGLVYLTLRAIHDPGPHWMPGAQSDLAVRDPVARRHLIVWPWEGIDDADGLRVSGRPGVVQGVGGFLLGSGPTFCWLEPGMATTGEGLLLQFPTDWDDVVEMADRAVYVDG